MNKILLGNPGSGKTYTILNELKEDLSVGKTCLYINPNSYELSLFKEHLEDIFVFNMHCSDFNLFKNSFNELKKAILTKKFIFFDFSQCYFNEINTNLNLLISILNEWIENLNLTVNFYIEELFSIKNHFNLTKFKVFDNCNYFLTLTKKQQLDLIKLNFEIPINNFEINIINNFKLNKINQKKYTV